MVMQLDIISPVARLALCFIPIAYRDERRENALDETQR